MWMKILKFWVYSTQKSLHLTSTPFSKQYLQEIIILKALSNTNFFTLP